MSPRSAPEVRRGKAPASHGCHSFVDDGEGQIQKEVDALPLALRRYIQEDNWKLEQELAEWEEQSSKIPLKDQSTPSSESLDLSSDSIQGESSACPFLLLVHRPPAIPH